VGKNVAVFVDVANIFYAAKAAGVDIDYVTLLKSAGAGRDMVRAYAYTGLDPENENQRNFHDFLRRHGYKVVSKDIRKYGDGKVKANLDIELVVDMMKTARNLDIAIVVSGDGDFAPAIRAVQEMGVRVEVISFRGNTSSDLIEVADLFTDITQLARVEKGSRSGRRVADDDADLSMTEVPDKQTEGTGAGRGVRGGRGRSRTRDTEPVAAASTSRGRGRGRTAAAASSTNGAGEAAAAGLVALPGERLSKASGDLTEADLAAAEVFTLDGPEETPAVALTEGDDGDDAPRRRRRRGGRGRGRGRGRDDVAAQPVAAAPPSDDSRSRPVDAFEEEEDEPEVAAPSGPRTTPFGSVWDSQLGTPTAPSTASLAPLADDEDFDEPEIPEYLIAEQRRGVGRGQRPAGRGPRGGRSAYQSAMERERYGRGSSGGINRYPDVSGRGGRPTAPRDDRAYGRDRPRDRDDRRGQPAPARSSSEPWSEVPPELEAMLRAQVASKPASGQAAPERVDSSHADVPDQPELVALPAADLEAPAPKKRATTRKPATSKAKAPATKTRTPRKAATASSSESNVTAAGDADAASTAAPRKRTTRKTASTAAANDAGADGSPAETAPKRRTRKTATTPAEPA
jgi:uncharacterized LabA/DUF88 family protein